MPTVRLHMTSKLSAPQLMAVLTDFSAARPTLWPTIDADHFEVHAVGDTWAEVTEGTASAWERARYDWDPQRHRVTITTHDSKVFGPGGGWVFQLTPHGTTTKIDVELTRRPTRITRRLLAALLPLVAPASLKKSFAGPLQAH
jgi:YD repeat-containing protein